MDADDLFEAEFAEVLLRSGKTVLAQTTIKQNTSEAEDITTSLELNSKHTSSRGLQAILPPPPFTLPSRVKWSQQRMQ